MVTKYAQLLQSTVPAMAFADCLEDLDMAYEACPNRPEDTSNMNEVARHVEACPDCLHQLIILQQLKGVKKVSPFN